MTTAGADTEDVQARRHVAAVFDKFERDVFECQELLCRATNEWLLSTDDQPSSALGTSAAADGGIITSLNAIPQSRLILLFPADDTGFAGGVLDMHEVFLPSCTAVYIFTLGIHGNVAEYFY